MKNLLSVFIAGAALAAIYFALRDMIGTDIAMLVAVSSGSVAATGVAGAKAGGATAAHAPAAAGALAGALLLSVAIRDRPWPERAVLTLASYLMAHYGGLLASEQWAAGPGTVAMAGAACARLGAAALDTAHRIVRDAEWIKSMLARRK